VNATFSAGHASMLSPDQPGIWSIVWSGGGTNVQSAQPRDVGALALVVGLLLILFVVSVMYGSPVR
jgi:uncharacterized membrane-anchored protein